MAKAKRNDPCPCGSGKKYKNCCYSKMYKEIPADKTEFNFTLDDGTKTSRQIISIDSIPKHNLNGHTPNISIDQMMDLCLDEIHKILEKEEVGMLVDLVDKVIQEMDIIPIFTYGQISKRMEIDSRFEIFRSQICSVKGTNPVELIEKKLRM
jgi:hypothetical protein